MKDFALLIVEKEVGSDLTLPTLDMQYWANSHL